MKNKLTEVIIFVIFLSLIFYPDLVHKEIIDALKVFYKTLFPSIFPFFLFGNLLISYNFFNTVSIIFKNFTRRIFHISGNSFFIIIMSMVSGFPSGAKYIRDLYDKNLISIDQANYLIVFTHFANPLFVITVTSVIFNDLKISYMILISMYLSNFIIAFITRPKKVDEVDYKKAIENTSFSIALSNALKDSFNVLIMILGNTCFFYLISRLVTFFLSPPIFIEIIINGFFDLTKGISSLGIINTSILLKGMLTLSFISFGGINIHMQVLNMIQDTKIKYNNFLLGRIAQASISSCLFFIFYTL